VPRHFDAFAIFVNVDAQYIVAVSDGGPIRDPLGSLLTGTPFGAAVFQVRHRNDAD